MSGPDPICACGVARSEHQLCGCPAGFEPRQHPDVALAIQHRKVRERYEDGPEREPEFDLRAEVHELASAPASLCTVIDLGMTQDGRRVVNAVHRSAHAIRERLS